MSDVPTKSLEAQVPSRTANAADMVKVVRDPGLPAAQGLYNPANEQDSCGVGFIADMKNRKSHEIVEQGLAILHNLDHRGAVGADKLMGDGAGILIQIPDDYYRAEMAKQGVELPAPGEYGVGMIFLPKEHASRLACEQALERVRHRHPFDLDEVDITRDDALHARYLERIPVVALDGEELFEYFVDEATLVNRLGRRTA